MRVGRLGAVAAIWFTAAGAPVLAQIASGTITGIVTDQAAAGLPGVTVSVTAVETGIERRAVTTRAGLYTIAGLAPGAYRLDAMLDRFKPLRREGIQVAIGEHVRVDLVLTLGQLSEQVTVTADAAALRIESGSLGTAVSPHTITQAPLNGRTFIALAALAPGVTLPPDSQLPRINGGRPRTNEYLYDGISVLQPEPGQVAFFPVLDAIQGFTIESNSPPAEFGRFNGGVVNLTTKAGTNAVHGTAFEFFRDEHLNARNFFQSTDPTKPEYARHQFGGTVGGPIVRDRTFFFADYQQQRQSLGRTVISTVPTLLQRQGIFTEAIGGRVPAIYDPATTQGSDRSPFADNTIPLSQIDPIALALLQRYPSPTDEGTANNFRRTANEIDNQHQWDARIDHTFASNRDRLFARLSRFQDDITPVTFLPDGSGSRPSGAAGAQKTAAWAIASDLQHTFSTGVLNELRAGDTRRKVTRRAATVDGPAGAALHIPGIPASARFPDTLPTFLISGYQQLGSPANTASDFGTSVSEVADTLTVLKGRHTFRTGLDWRWERLNVVQPPSPTGSFTFNAIGSDLPGVPNTGTPLASFLLGQVQLFSIDLQQRPIQERARVHEYFFQDDWKVSSRLTANLGLRYTLNFPSTEINGQTAVFNLHTGMIEYPGTQPVRQLKKNNLAPRLAAAYRANGRTIFSAGYGLVWIEMAGITTPFTTPTFPFLQTVGQRALDNIAPAFVLRDGPSVSTIAPTPTAGLGQGVFAVDATLGSGYVQQWNASMQRELSPNTTLELSYLGSAITHVGVPDTNLNQLTVGQLAKGASLLTRVPNPYFGAIPRSSSLGDPTIPLAQLLKPYPQYTTVSLYRNNVGTTRYDAFAVSVRRRLSRGLSYSMSYTRSRLVDDASSVFDASVLTGPVANYPVADSFNRAGERDYSTGDIPHAFVAAAVWEISGWTLAPIVRVQSGSPVAVTQGTNANAFAGFGVQRPDLIGNPELPPAERSVARWFNTAAFSQAAPFTVGTASRNPVRGPSFRDVDLALIRHVPVAGRTLELRVEVFNLLNTPALGPPAGVFGAPDFGTITTAFDPRVVQLAGKLLF